MVVPTSSSRNPIRAGVTIRMVMSRANGVTGVMSPYPVVVTLTEA